MKLINSPIEVVAVFDEKGSIRPLRIRITTEYQSQKVILVNKFLHKDFLKIAGTNMIAFTCQIVLNDLEKICEIRFDILKCKWYLYKI